MVILVLLRGYKLNNSKRYQELRHFQDLISQSKDAVKYLGYSVEIPKCCTTLVGVNKP